MPEQHVRKQARRTNEAKTKTGRKRQHAGATINMQEYDMRKQARKTNETKQNISRKIQHSGANYKTCRNRRCVNRPEEDTKRSRNISENKTCRSDPSSKHHLKYAALVVSFHVWPIFFLSEPVAFPTPKTAPSKHSKQPNHTKSKRTHTNTTNKPKTHTKKAKWKVIGGPVQ